MAISIVYVEDQSYVFSLLSILAGLVITVYTTKSYSVFVKWRRESDNYFLLLTTLSPSPSPLSIFTLPLQSFIG